MTVPSRLLAVMVLAGLAACNGNDFVPDSAASGSGRILFRSRDPHGITSISALYAINPDGSGLAKLVDSMSGATGSALSPDGTKLAFGSTGVGIYWLDLTSVVPTPHLVGSTQVVGIVNWAEDSRQILFDDEVTARIGAVGVDGSAARILLNGLYPSAGGGLIAYQLGGHVWISNADATNWSALDTVSNESEGGPVQPSPDGQHLAMQRSFDDRVAHTFINGQLFVYDIASRGFRQLTHGTQPIGAPTWSPDGRRIAYQSDGRVYIINADGSGAFQVSPDDLAISKAAVWSPHGTRLAFVANDDVYVVNADGSGLQNLTNSGAVDFDVHWTAQE